MVEETLPMPRRTAVGLSKTVSTWNSPSHSDPTARFLGSSSPDDFLVVEVTRLPLMADAMSSCPFAFKSPPTHSISNDMLIPASAGPPGLVNVYCNVALSPDVSAAFTVNILSGSPFTEDLYDTAYPSRNG